MKRLIFVLVFAIMLIGFVYASNCGDNELNNDEECDDGNTQNGDGCSSVCDIEGEISCEPRQKIGDINGDNVINSLDAQIIISMIFRGVEIPNDICCIDADQSGSVEVSDAVMVVSIGNNEAQSPGRCSYVVSCGDGIVDSGEQCDYGEDNGERCDNDNHDCEYCSAGCKIIELEEEEDDNNYREKRPIFLYDNNGGIFCNPNWKCTGWTDCDGGVQTRNCRDSNNCEYPLNKPIEKTSCESNVNYVFINEEYVEEEYYSIPFGLIILIAVLFLFILVFAVNWRYLGRR